MLTRDACGCPQVLSALGTTDEMLGQNAGFCSVCAGDPDDVVGIPCGWMAAAAAPC